MLVALLTLSLAACGQAGAPQSSESSSQPPLENRIAIEFPAYQDGKNEHNSPLYEIPPFTVTLTLPQDWEVRLPPEEERSPGLDFFTPVLLYHGDSYKGYMGFNVYTPVEGEIPQEDYYQVVFPFLRLSSMCTWDQYTPVRSTDSAEVALATVNYKDPEEIEGHPGAMADVPFLQAPGILAYDKELQVSMGIRFMKDAVPDEEVRAIAERVLLQPSA